jgi:Family of unknown function (DUF6338)
MIIPGTLGQVLAVVFLILPGFVFAAVRARLRGPSPADGEFGQRLLTAIVFGAVLDSLYILIGGRHVTALFTPQSPAEWMHDPRLLTLAAFGLLVLAPAALAKLDDLRLTGHFDIPLSGDRTIRLRYRGRYEPTPTAWDYAGPRLGDTFIRVRQPDGSWVGGWFGSKSFLSTWPEPHDLFIESQWIMDADGAFKERLAGSRGVYVSCPQDVVVEWVEAPAPTGSPGG